MNLAAAFNPAPADTPPLYPHQAETVAFMCTHPEVMNHAACGTGKCRSYLEALREHRNSGGGAAFVLAPKTILQSAWAADAERFTPELKVSIATADNRRCCMTGTPMPNSLLDIFAQALLVDRGERLGTSFWKFRDQVCLPEPVAPGSRYARWVTAEWVADALRRLRIQWQLCVQWQLSGCLFRYSQVEHCNSGFAKKPWRRFLKHMA